MLANPNNLSRRRLPGLPTPILRDRRRHKRISGALLHRITRQTVEEHPCKLVEISAGVAIVSPVPAIDGRRPIANSDHGGGIEGFLARPFKDGLAIKINAARHTREKLAGRLTWLAHRGELVSAERRHDRLTPKDGGSTLRLGEGGRLTRRVLDVSILGASGVCALRPDIATSVVLGEVRSRVVRQHLQGFGVQFIDSKNPAASGAASAEGPARGQGVDANTRGTAGTRQR
jgi:hypothetical protein